MTKIELLALRKKLNWTQYDAAKNLGCSVRSIVNWEIGTNKIPKYIALATSALLFNLPPYGSGD